MSNLQPTGNHTDQAAIFKIVREAKKTVGLSQISEDDKKTLMEHQNIVKRDEGHKATVKDFLFHEMSMPIEESDKLSITKIFRPAGAGPDSEKMFVEFEEDHMPGKVYRYVRKLNPSSSIHNYVQPQFKARANNLAKCGYELRHGYPHTKQRLGRGHVTLCLKESRSQTQPRGTDLSQSRTSQL